MNLNDIKKKKKNFFNNINYSLEIKNDAWEDQSLFFF